MWEAAQVRADFGPGAAEHGMLSEPGKCLRERVNEAIRG
jgi:hypothetical protein